MPEICTAQQFSVSSAASGHVERVGAVRSREFRPVGHGASRVADPSRSVTQPWPSTYLTDEDEWREVLFLNVSSKLYTSVGWLECEILEGGGCTLSVCHQKYHVCSPRTHNQTV